MNAIIHSETFSNVPGGEVQLEASVTLTARSTIPAGFSQEQKDRAFTLLDTALDRMRVFPERHKGKIEVDSDVLMALSEGFDPDHPNVREIKPSRFNRTGDV